MIRWLVLETTPRQQIHGPDALPYLDYADAAHQVLVGMGTLRGSVDGEIPNMTVQAENESGEAVALWRIPPLGIEAVIYGIEGGETIEQFRGIVVRVTLSQPAELEIQA